MIIMKPDPNPIIISDGKVEANLDISFSIKNMGAIEVGKYYHRKGIKVYSNEMNCKGVESIICVRNHCFHSTSS